MATEERRRRQIRAMTERGFQEGFEPDSDHPVGVQRSLAEAFAWLVEYAVDLEMLVDLAVEADELPGVPEDTDPRLADLVRAVLLLQQAIGTVGPVADVPPLRADPLDVSVPEVQAAVCSSASRLIDHLEARVPVGTRYGAGPWNRLLADLRGDLRKMRDAL